MEDRLATLRKIILSKNLDGILISSVPNVGVLSGFTGDSSMLVVTSDAQMLVTDFRFVEQAERECSDWTIVRRDTGFYKTLAGVLSDAGVRRLGFESAHLTHAQHERLSSAAAGVTLTPLLDTVERLRETKTDEEVAHIEAALRIQETALREVMTWVRPGMTEKRVASELDHRMRLNGAEASAFETIVAAGERASLPHAQPTERVISQGDALLIDWGARRFFFNSDLTRMLHFGSVSAEFRKVYEVVAEAQTRAMDVVRPGATFAEVDAAAREHIRRAGYGERFGHALGHGVGREVHESPVVGEGNEDRLAPGMVFTVEPGIYIPTWGGVRIEDMVLVTDNGVRVLSDFEKNLDALVL